MAARRPTPPQPPPPPPRILNLPRRTRSKTNTRSRSRALDRHHHRELGALINDERRTEQRGIVIEDSSADEGWKLRAEILRAECQFLREERQLAVKKMERNRERMETFLKSAMDNLVSGREKIDGKEMEEEIKSLGMAARRIQGSIMDQHHHHHHVEMLRRKMEVVSKGVMERVVEEVNLHCMQVVEVEEMEVKVGCSYCKEVVRRVVEQVRSETDHWNEMQGMVEKVKLEMEELQLSKDLWQRRAMSSDLSLRSVHARMLEWQWRAQASETKVVELQKVIEEMKSLRTNGDQVLNLNQKSNSREKEKHVVVCHLKSKNQNQKREFARRSVLQEIGNLR
ncbi:hypothetical protein J5N97_010566 [Dioscorea zingiberensis]|uniref:Uncharacterized protein n=1 Tax=Dioscorea zingiberensis TaxID=325984 RepID=A0A9D5CYY9_9LILI|nr:hypothetical protein J5N97_010566 [Dioscorea zingiberensis]